MCASLKTILESEKDISVIGLGYNGKEAVDLYGHLNPDILLMDIRMETMTGLEAAESILINDKEIANKRILVKVL